MAAALKEKFSVDAELIKSKGGIFDVEVDGQLLFSKSEHLRFPTHEEIISLIEQM